MLTHQLDEQSELRLLQPHQAVALFALTDTNRKHLRRWLPWVDGNTTLKDTRVLIRAR